MTSPSADRPFRRRVLVNTASVGIANGWAMVVALVALPLTLKGLGVVAFGTWALLQTFSAGSGWFSLLDLGLGTAATREVAARHGVDDRPGLADAVGSTVALTVGLGVVSGAILAAIGPWTLPTIFRTPDNLVAGLRVAVVAYGVQVAFDLASGGLQAVLDGYQRVDLSRAVDIVRRTAVAVAVSVAALVTHRLALVAVASAAATVVGTLLAAILVLRISRGLHPRSSRAMTRTLFRYGRSVALLRPLGVLHRTVDRFVVGAVLGPAAVSLVEVATQLQNGTDAVLSASSYAVVPSAARLEAQGERGKLAELLVVGTRYVLLCTWPVGAMTAVLGGPAIDLWVGAKYHDAAGLVVLAAMALAIVAPAQVASNLMLGTGRATAILRVAAIAIVVNVGLSVLLVKMVGVAGSFQATIVAALITLPLLLSAALSDLELDARDFLRRAVVPALPAAVLAAAGAAVVLALPLALLPSLLIGGVLGVGASAAGVLTWGLHPQERTSLVARLPFHR